MKKHNGLSALGDKIAHKSLRPSVHERFDNANQALGIDIETPESREKIIRKSYALTQPDIDRIKLIQDKCLNQKVVLNDSHVIRIALMLTSKLEEGLLIEASRKVPKLIAGRPKISK